MSQPDRAASPELALMIRLCLSPETISRQSFDGIDETKLFRMAHWHGVKNLVFAGLPEAARSGGLYQQLHASATHSTFQSLSQTNHLLDLFTLFQQEKIPAYGYKGILWSKWLYDDLNSRSSGDIDLLIPKAYFNEALKAVKMLGYEPDRYRNYLLTESSETQKAFFRTDYHVPLFNEEGIALELHWQPAYPRLCFDFPDQEWPHWQQEIVLQNRTVTGFRNEYQLLLLLLHHAGKERWDKLKYVADFVAYLHRYADATDWKLVVKLAQEKGMTGLLMRAIGMVNTLLPGHSFAVPVRSEISISDHLKKWDAMEELPENSTWPYFVHALRERDGLSYRLKILRSHLSYFSEYSLLRKKMSWYKQNADQSLS